MSRVFVVALACVLTGGCVSSPGLHYAGALPGGRLEEAVRKAERHLDDEVAFRTLQLGPYRGRYAKIESLSLLVRITGPNGADPIVDYATVIQTYFERLGVRVLLQPGGVGTLRISIDYDPVVAAYVDQNTGSRRLCHIGDNVDGAVELQIHDLDDKFDFKDVSEKPPEYTSSCPAVDGTPPSMNQALRNILLDIAWRVWGAHALAVAALDLDVNESEFEWKALNLLGTDAVEPILQVLAGGATADNVTNALMLLDNVPRWFSTPAAKRQLAGLIRACKGNSPALASIIESIDPQAATTCAELK